MTVEWRYVRLSARREMDYRIRLGPDSNATPLVEFHLESRSDKRYFARTYRVIYRLWLIPTFPIQGLPPYYSGRSVSRAARSAVQLSRNNFYRSVWDSDPQCVRGKLHLMLMEAARPRDHMRRVVCRCPVKPCR